MTRMALKAQVGLELIAAMIIILLILILIVSYSIERANESNEMRTFLDAKRVATSIGTNLDTIQEQGKGYYKYFTIPETIYGYYGYNVSISANVVEVSWGSRAWTVNTLSSNVTVYCLDYGENATNRVLNKGTYLVVTCNRPNLRPVGESLRYWNISSNVTVSFDVENEGHIASPGFDILVGGDRLSLAGLAPYQTIEVNHTLQNVTSGTVVVINADPDNMIEESIEDDNLINITITL
jgi:hypothetical protein